MKLKFYSSLLVILTLISLKSINAQDIHFSQYYASPMTLNPALTGKFDGLYRISGIYRSQWSGVAGVTPFFSTPSASVDFSLLKEKLHGSALGVGLAFVNDQQNANTVKSNKILLSIAYTQVFGPGEKYQLSLGFQPGYVLKTAGYDNARFTQGYYTDATLTHVNGLDATGNIIYIDGNKGESFSSTKANYFDFNTGLFFNMQPIQKLRFYIGYALYHVARPTEQFIAAANYTNKLDFRHVVHLGFEIDLNKKFVLIPGMLYQTTSKVMEVNFGLTAGYHVINKEDNQATLFLGLWTRVGRDIIPKLGFDYKHFRFGVSYDINVSSLSSNYKSYKDYYKANYVNAKPVLTAPGPHPNAWEISVSYIGNIFKPKENNYLFNPRF